MRIYTSRTFILYRYVDRGKFAIMQYHAFDARVKLAARTTRVVVIGIIIIIYTNI